MISSGVTHTWVCYSEHLGRLGCRQVRWNDQAALSKECDSSTQCFFPLHPSPRDYMWGGYLALMGPGFYLGETPSIHPSGRDEGSVCPSFPKEYRPYRGLFYLVAKRKQLWPPTLCHAIKSNGSVSMPTGRGRKMVPITTVDPGPEPCLALWCAMIALVLAGQGCLGLLSLYSHCSVLSQAHSFTCMRYSVKKNTRKEKM